MLPRREVARCFVWRGRLARVSFSYNHWIVIRRIAFVAVGLFFSLSLHAQSVDEIVAKALAARGGTAAIKAIQTERLSGHISFGKSPPGAFLVEIKRPGKMREEIAFGAKTLIQTTDGMFGWKLMTATGTDAPVAMTAGEVRNMAGGADIDGPLLDYAKKGSKVELIGEEKVGDRDAYKLKVTDKTGEVRYDYIDVNSYLEIKWEGEVENAGQKNTFASYFSDYRKVHGVMFAHTITSGTAESPNGQKIVFDKVEVNVPIDDAQFGKPSLPVSGSPAQLPVPHPN